MKPTSSRLRLFLPCAFIVAIYVAMGLWVRWHRMGPDWVHFLTASRVLIYGRSVPTPDGERLARTELYSLRARTVFKQEIVLPHGPVGIGLMAPFVAFCDATGLDGDFAAVSIIPWLPFLLFDVLAAVELMRAIRQLRPDLGPAAELFVFALYMTCWATFFTSPYHAHFESVLIFFVLLAVRMQARGCDALAGALLGLAYLTKPTAALAVIVQCVVLMFHRQWRRAAITLGLSIAVTGAVMLPFLLADARSVLYMVFGAPQDLPIKYMSIWYGLIRSQAAAEFVRLWANTAALIVAVLLAVLFAWRRRIDPGSVANYGLLALATVASLAVLKWGSLHYYLLPLAILLVWDIAANRFPWISITYIAVLSNIFILWLSYETKPTPGLGVQPPGIVFAWQSAWLMITLFAGTIIYLCLRVGRESTEKSAVR